MVMRLWLVGRPKGMLRDPRACALAAWMRLLNPSSIFEYLINQSASDPLICTLPQR